MPTRVVYALVDPNTYRIRYIGRSRQGLVRPLLHEMRSHNAAITAWVADMKFCGATYTTIILAEASDDNELFALEKFWIDLGVKCGWPLCNTQGVSSRNPALAAEPEDPDRVERAPYYRKSDAELSRAARKERRAMRSWRRDPEVQKALSAARTSRVLSKKSLGPQSDPLMDRLTKLFPTDKT